MSFSRNVISGVLTRLFRRKSMARESLELNTSQLARVLTVWDLTALGVGSTLGNSRFHLIVTIFIVFKKIITKTNFCRYWNLRSGWNSGQNTGWSCCHSLVLYRSRGFAISR
jgi:hypothetical protein